MKTNRFIQLISVLFIIAFFASCNDDDDKKIVDDSVGFVENFYSIEPDDTLDIEVMHISVGKTGTQAELEVVDNAGAPASIASIDKTVLNFNEADTLIVQLTVDTTSFPNVGDSSGVTIQFTDSYVQHTYGGFKKAVVSIKKE